MFKYTLTRLMTLLLCFAGFATAAGAQDFAAKVNLVGAATFTPNLSLEAGLGKRTTLELGGYYNGWHVEGTEESNKKLAHWFVQPEFRYWLCERFNGHFFGAHMLYGEYNVSGYDIPLMFDKEYRYEGSAVGGGLSYGYHWMWSRKWGMEFNLGLGMLMMKYDKYDCAKCGDKLGTFDKTYFGPTKIGLSLVFLIR